MFGLDFLPIAARQMLLTGQPPTSNASNPLFAQTGPQPQLPAHLAHLPGLPLGALQSLQTSPAATLQQLEQLYQGGAVGDGKHFDAILQDAAQRALLLSQLTSSTSSTAIAAPSSGATGVHADGGSEDRADEVSEEDSCNNNNNDRDEDEDHDRSREGYCDNKQRRHGVKLQHRLKSSKPLKTLTISNGGHLKSEPMDDAERDIDVELSDDSEDPEQTD